MKNLKLTTHYPIEALGNVKVGRGDIRIERLQDRLDSKVPFPHRHDFYQMIFISNGSGNHLLDFKDHLVERAQYFVVKPGQIHGWKLSAKTQGFVVEFTIESLSEKGLDTVLNLRLLPDMVKVKNKSELDKTFQLLKLMFDEFTDKQTSYRIALQNYLNLLLVEILRVSPVKLTLLADADSLLEKFRLLVDINFQKHRDVEFYSQEMGLTAKALTMRMTRAVGVSARHIIYERVLLEAKRLLIYSDVTISEVGYQLGYEDPNYFVRFFHEQVGLTPLKFRKRERDKIS